MLTTLTILLVILKLAGVISWSWFLVLLPTISEVGVGLVALVGFGVVALFVALLGRR